MRANIVMLVVGKPRQGKTTLVRSFCEKIKLPKLVLDINNEELWEDYEEGFSRQNCRVFSPDMSDLFPNLLSLVNRCIVFEDSTVYIKPQVQKEIRTLIACRRHRNLDLIFTFHSLKDVPPFLFRMTNYLVLLKTQDSDFKSMPNQEEIQKTVSKLKKMPDYSWQLIELN